MSMRSRYKSSYKRRIKLNSNRIVLLTISILLFLAVVGVSVFLLVRINSKDTPNENENMINIYIAKENIQHGQLITNAMLEEIQITRSMPDDYYCSSDCFNQIAAVDIPKGMTILQNMLCSPELEEGQREVECQIIALSDNLVDNDYVDIRIMLPNGEDYIVLAKKSVHDLLRTEDSKDEKCYLWMSEDEILYYSAAIVDAYLYPGSSLYTTKYIQPTVQEASLITYVPSLGTITMMKENPNLLQEAIQYLKEDNRKQLENRLTDYLNKDVREVLWNETESKTEETSSETNIDIEMDATIESSSDEAMSMFVDDTTDKEAPIE